MIDPMAEKDGWKEGILTRNSIDKYGNARFEVNRLVVEMATGVDHRERLSRRSKHA